MIAFTPHTGKVTALSFSPDGSRLASVSSDRSLKVWDVSRLGVSEPAWEVRDAHAHSIGHCQYAWSGAVVFTGGKDGLMKAWDARDGQLVACTDPDTHPDARGRGRRVHLVAVRGVRRLRRRELVAADGLRGGARRGFDARPLRDGPRQAVGVFSAWENGFASGSADRTVRLWDWESATCHAVLPLRGLVRGLTCSRDGRHLTAAGGAVIHRYAAPPVAESGHHHVKTGDLRGHTKRVDCLELTPDGTRLASASDDGTVRVWDTATGTELRVFHPKLGPLHWIAFAPDGLTLAFSSQKGHVGLLDMDG